jgi:hypothetical protein
VSLLGEGSAQPGLLSNPVSTTHNMRTRSDTSALYSGGCYHDRRAA